MLSAFTVLLNRVVQLQESRLLWRAVFLVYLGAMTIPSLSAADYVGSNVCRGCHGAIFNAFYRNPHYKTIASGTAAPEKTGCEGCHGPASDHIRAGGGKLTIPNAFSQMKPAKIVDTCLGCHSQTVSRANIRKSEHTLNDVVCNTCHSVHSSTSPKFLLASGLTPAQKAGVSQAPSAQRDLCYSCHTTVRAQFSMPFKHRVNEGSIECTDCHNPHGSFAATWTMGSRPRMVEQAEGNEQPCLKCHIDKRGPFVYEHAAVRVEGCATCHNAHGSTNTRLLKRPVTFTLCLECHNGFANFGRSNNGVLLQSNRHDMTDPKYQNCITCHARIHGSNTSATFLR